jgi:hypothetical protein
MTNSAMLGPVLALAVAAAAGCLEPGPDAADAGADAGSAAALGAAGTAPAWSAAGQAGEHLLEPYNVHATWQASPESTLTFTWLTLPQSGYAPKVQLAPCDQASPSDAGVQLPSAPENLFAGAGAAYAAGVGDRIAWTVEATDLAADTEYCYRVGTWDYYDQAAQRLVGPRLGPVRRARTAPPRGSLAPFAFGVAGDTQGATADLSEHAAEIAASGVLFWLLTGDQTTNSSQGAWDDWFAAIAPMLDGAVGMAVPGNHEVSYGTFYGQFALPIEPDLAPELAERAWSIDVGNVHIVGLDSNISDYESIAAWLEADLAATDADPAIDWRIVIHHHPAYSASTHGCTPRVLEHWAPLYDAHGVDLVFSGHDHDYERTYRIADGFYAPLGEGVTYVVAGGFFASLYGAGTEWWTAYSETTDVYVVVTVEGYALHLVAYDPNDETVIDSVSLFKPVT